MTKVEKLIKAIMDNIESIEVVEDGHESYEPIIRLQYINEELEDMKKEIKQ